MASAETLVEFRAAWIGFDRPLLGPLDIRIPAGARWALTGPNGSGKSLLLRALVGQASLHAGSIRLAPATRTTLLAQDHPRRHPWPLSGLDWFDAMNATLPERPRIRELLPRRLDRLSGGQWQLLRLASALATPVAGEPPGDGDAPRLVLLDEPANHLDTEVRQDALELIRAVPDGTTLVITSHDPAFLSELGLENRPLATLLRR